MLTWHHCIESKGDLALKHFKGFPLFTFTHIHISSSNSIVGQMNETVYEQSCVIAYWVEGHKLELVDQWHQEEGTRNCTVMLTYTFLGFVTGSALRLTDAIISLRGKLSGEKTGSPSELNLFCCMGHPRTFELYVTPPPTSCGVRKGSSRSILEAKSIREPTPTLSYLTCLW